MGLEVTLGHRLGLGPEPELLLFGDIQLAVAVGELLGIDAQLEPVGQVRVDAGLSGQRGHLHREPDDEDRIDDGGKQKGVVQLEDELAGAPLGKEVHLVLLADVPDLVDGVGGVEAATHQLRHPVEELAAGPRRGQVDGSVADLEVQPAGGRGGGGGDQALGQVHAVVDVAERLVGLEGGELRTVAGVDPLVAEVPGDLEDPFIATDHQSLQVELGGDPEAEVDVQRIGVGEEGSGQGTARLRLQHRGVHLDEAVLHQLLAEGGDGPKPDVEDGSTLRVGQQVDLPLAVAGVGGGQAVPFVGERAQRLGQQPQFGDVQRELATSAGDHLALGTHPVTQIEDAQDGGGRLGQGRCLHQQLYRAGDVGQGGEGELAVAADAGQPAGQPHCCTGPGIGIQLVVPGVEVGGQGRPVEADRVRVDPLGGENIALVAALGGECIERRRRRLFVVLVGHVRTGLGGHADGLFSGTCCCLQPRSNGLRCYLRQTHRTERSRKSIST